MEQIISTHYLRHDHWSELVSNDTELVKKAFEICENAYAPYSQFHVGAAVRLNSGEVVTGSNQENIAYPSGLCAERVALFYVGANFPNASVETICIVAKGDLLPKEKILSPCGGCRQVMLETETRQKKAFRVILVSQNGVTIIFNSAEDLLPLAFGITE